MSFIVDFDRSINFCVNQIRMALDDDPQRPRYIETLPRKGYRFIAPIEAPVPEPDVAAKPRLARLWWGAAVLLAIVVAAVLWQPGPKRIESLAVLPLENLSHDPDQDYFAAGMTDELITDLAKIGALRVISRTSVMPCRGTKKPLPQIAREQVTPREHALLAATRAVDPEAYEAYLRGLYLNPTEDNLKKSLHYFQQAADKDASYAPAWAQIAEVYDMMAAYGLL